MEAQQNSTTVPLKAIQQQMSQQMVCDKWGQLFRHKSSKLSPVSTNARLGHLHLAGYVEQPAASDSSHSCGSH